MEFTQGAKERRHLTLMSGLLCAVMLMPAALAHSSEIDREEPPPVATANANAGSETALPPVNPADDVKPAEQQKAVKLSRHIQRKYRIPEHKADEIVRQAVDNGGRHQVEPELILAIIAVESTFRERAVSRVGARGLMQVLPRAHGPKIREIGGSHHLFDPVKNIHVGSRILVDYLDDHSGNLRGALLRYNGSLGTRSSFPDRVMRIYRDLRRVTTEG